MILNVLISFKVRINGKEITLHPGQTIKVQEGVARRLLAERKVMQIGGDLNVREGTKDRLPKWQGEENKFATVKIYSHLLNDTLWVCWDEEEMKELMAQGTKEPIYIAEEIPILENKAKVLLKNIHQVKKFFPGALVKA